MDDVVNLRQARKRKQRAEAEAKAAVNRATFGVPKSTRIREQAERSLTIRRLDAHRIGEKHGADE